MELKMLIYSVPFLGKMGPWANDKFLNFGPLPWLSIEYSSYPESTPKMRTFIGSTFCKVLIFEIMKNNRTIKMVQHLRGHGALHFLYHAKQVV